MTRYLFVAIAVLVALLSIQTSRLHSARVDRARLEENQTALMTDIRYYRSRLGREVASTQALRLQTAEYENLRTADAAAIRDLGIKIRRVEATTKTASQTVVNVHTLLRDTVVVKKEPLKIIADTLRTFQWSDPWVSITGLIDGDSVACRLQSIDTLRQVIHRIPRRFLFIKWGTKAIQQEIFSTNPHNRIVYTEYIKIEK